MLGDDYGTGADDHRGLPDARKRELQRLKSEERPRIIQPIAEARAHGDLSENAEYHAAKEAQGFNEARVADLEDRIGRADVIDTSKLSGNTVKFGATVTLVDEDTDEKVKYKIVGDFEASVRDGKISISSPIARALIGKSKNDTVEVTTPKGARSYKILKIEWKYARYALPGAGMTLASHFSARRSARPARAWRGGW